MDYNYYFLFLFLHDLVSQPVSSASNNNFLDLPTLYNWWDQLFS